MKSGTKGTGRGKAATTRQKAGRVMPEEEEGRGRLGKRAVRAPRTDRKQRGGDLQRRHSGA